MSKKIVIFVAIFVLSVAAFAQSTLVGAILITRHGDRAPNFNVGNDKYNWGVPFQELTPIGMNQAYSLGTQLRSDLVTNEKLLPAHYQPGTVYVEASDLNRTFDTASCVLTGLYPPGTGPKISQTTYALPGGIQPIPIFTLPANNFLILTPTPQWMALLQKYVYTSAPWLQLQSQYQSKFSTWSKILGTPINNLQDAINVGNVMMAIQAHSFAIPKGLSTQDFNDLISLTNQGFAIQFKNMNVSYAMGGQLVTTIGKNLQAMSSGNTPVKLFYYSGHETTILPVMAVLGNPLNSDPGYAANILVKLYQDGSNYYVEVLYNGKLLKMKAMGNQQKIPLATFENYINSVNQEFSGSSTISS